MKNFIKTIMVFAICMVFCLGILTSCRTPAQSENPKMLKVGVSLYDEYDVFIGVFFDYFTKYAREMEKEKDITISILMNGANGNQYEQNNQIESFIESGCDVICVNIVDRTDATIIIDKASTANIPLIFFNREIVAEDLMRAKDIYYLGAPASQSGQLQGENAADFCRSNLAKVDKNGDGIIQYVMLEGQKNHQDAILRTKFTIETFVNLGFRVEKLESEPANWVRSEAETKIANWLAKGHEIEIVFSNNDEMAIGAYDAIQKHMPNPADRPLIFGIDGTPAGLKALIDGKIDGTVFNDAPEQARAMLALVLYSVLGEEPPAEYAPNESKSVFIDYKPIPKEEAPLFLKIFEE